MSPFPAWARSCGPKLGGELRKHRIAFVLGTRPEAIKLAPIAQALAALGEQPSLLVTGQHPGLELRAHRLHGLRTEQLHCPGQPDPMLHADLVRSALMRVLPLAPPRLIVVLGGTSSALGGALAARETGIPLAHVDAGLRTFDPNAPWPEEENRVAIDRHADLLFAPTCLDATNLLRERVTGQVVVTGSSGMDALMEVADKLPAASRWRIPWGPFRLLVTCHRRENWEGGIGRLAAAVERLAKANSVTVLLPPNPALTGQMTILMSGMGRVRLLPPQSHAATIGLMRSVDLILSDSFGIEEEALALGIPLLVLRDSTERLEGLTAGASKLVGIDPDRIVEVVERLRRNKGQLKAMARPSQSLGDGCAGPRIARLCIKFLDAASIKRQARTA